MIYCISDIHGEYDAYQQILEKIHLSSADTLYVLGDVIDRGRHGIKILHDMMYRSNVIPIIGNHEYMAMYCLKFLMKNIDNENINALGNEQIEALTDWLLNGARPTIDEFYSLGKEERLDIIDYIGDFRLYEEVSVGENNYILVHSGIRGFSVDKPLNAYSPYDFLFTRPDYSVPYSHDVFVVSGHTPTQIIPGNPNPGRIYRANNHIAIDCGCSFEGVLGAICLDTGEEFYTN